MSKQKLLPVLAILGATLFPSVSFADASHRAPCILREHHVTSVTPYKVMKQEGRVAVQQLQGAQVFVQAEPGLTAEWLQLTLTQHLAAMRGSTMMKDCAFDLDGVRVQVDPAGTGFAVKLIARDANQAAEVLRRAELLRG